jgi:hypothetical protein
MACVSKTFAKVPLATYGKPNHGGVQQWWQNDVQSRCENENDLFDGSGAWRDEPSVG